MHAQLVFFASFGIQTVQAVCAAIFDQFDGGKSIRLALDFLREVKLLTTYQTRGDAQRVV